MSRCEQSKVKRVSFYMTTEEFELMYFMTFHDDPKVGASNSISGGPEPCRV